MSKCITVQTVHALMDEDVCAWHVHVHVWHGMKSKPLPLQRLGTDQNSCTFVVPFLLWLIMEGGRSVKDLALHFLLWVAFVVETGPLVAHCTGDVLVAAPVPCGAKRARRLDPDLGHAIARAAGAKEGGRTSGQ
eukprot:11226393-Lingulodinium_polyedra.AAC.2